MFINFIIPLITEVFIAFSNEQLLNESFYILTDFKSHIYLKQKKMKGNDIRVLIYFIYLEPQPTFPCLAQGMQHSLLHFSYEGFSVCEREIVTQ